MKLFPALFLFAASVSSFAQNIKNETVEYRYLRLPNAPLDPTLKNYTASITAVYESENEKKKAEYEAKVKVADSDFQKEKLAYPAKLAAAELSYSMEMDAWKKKSMGEKFVERQVLGENNKPVKNLPSEPYRAHVKEPELRSSYDYNVLCKTYISLGGFQNLPEKAVQIQITLYGFDFTQPQQMSLQRDMTSFSNGSTQTYKQTYYYNEFSYRHPMSVKVTLPDGKEILNLTPQELNTYKVYKTSESTTSQAINQQLLIKTYEEKILQENLTFINNLVNDKYGFQPTLRKAELQFVKSKDDTYKDLLIAFNEASTGLKTLAEDTASAKPKLRSAIKAWELAMLESDPKNKKARIDKDVTIAVAFNLLEGYFALWNGADAEKIITVLNSINLSGSERRQKESFELLFSDLKKRLAVQK